jgi:RNA:NAD 2'-phosphotransferase (TPT1/KptA family)
MHAPARTRTDARLAQGIRASAREHAHMFACTHEHALGTAQHSTALPALTAHTLLVCGPQPWHFTSGHTGAP